MPLIQWSSIFLCLITLGSQCQDDKPKQEVDTSKKVLVFSKTAEFRHISIEAGVIALRTICKNLNIDMDHSEDASLFVEGKLEKYQLVLFLSTTGDILNDQQQEAFEKYMKAGGNFMGVHAATDTEYDWPWYNRLVGAYFANHPKIQEASINVIDPEHIACKHLSNPWIRTGEWYNFKSIIPGMHVLLTLDESTYEGGIHGEDHPYAWCQSFENGKSFYTACGHTVESFSEPEFIGHLEGGIKWCLGMD